jgi:hypothetical protein
MKTMRIAYLISALAIAFIFTFATIKTMPVNEKATLQSKAVKTISEIIHINRS